ATALVANGELDAARVVLDDLTERAHRFDRRVVWLGAARAEALYLTARGEPRQGVTVLTEALREHASHSYPIDVVRGRLTLGRLHRRLRRRSQARRAYTEAAELATAIGAAPWLALTREELARLDAAGSSTRQLSRAEQRIVDLIAQGLTNRD